MPTLSVQVTLEDMLQLERYCRDQGVSKTDIILKLLREHVLGPPRKSAYQVAEELGLIGAFEGPSDLGRRHSHHVKKKLRAEHSR